MAADNPYRCVTCNGKIFRTRKSRINIILMKNTHYKYIMNLQEMSNDDTIIDYTINQ